MRIILFILFILFISCSSNVQRLDNNRTPASSFIKNCFEAVRSFKYKKIKPSNLLSKKEEQKSPEETLISQLNDSDKSFYLKVIKERTRDENENNLTSDDVRRFQNFMETQSDIALENIDDNLSFLTHNNNSIENRIKSLPTLELSRLYSHRLSFVGPYYTFEKVLKKIFRQERSINQTLITDIQPMILKYLFNDFKEKNKVTEYLDGYRIIINIPELHFDKSRIPLLIELHRSNTESLEKKLKRLSSKDLEKLNETARAFLRGKNHILFLENKPPYYREEYELNDNFNYIFSRIEEELRRREIQNLKLEKTDIDSKSRIQPPLTIKEDTFNINSEYSDQDLLLSYLSLHSSKNFKIVPSEIRKILMELLELENEVDLLQEKSFNKLEMLFKDNIEEEDIDYVFGRSLHSTKKMQDKIHDNVNNNQIDFARGWGWRLLPDNDSAWNDPEFLKYTLRLTNAFGGGLSAQDSRLYHEIEDLFRSEWNKLSPTYKPRDFTLTGSDANNLLYNIALKHVRILNPNAKDSEILYMDGLYGGVRGKSAGMSFHGMGKQEAPDIEKYKIPSPRYTKEPTTESQLKIIEEKEKESLELIEKKVIDSKNTNKPIGAIFLESIQNNSNGFSRYRKKYLLKLQALCKELNILIMVDEILSGGGRTGKFWAFEHYEGFEPDIITFGKGLQVAGVATKSISHSLSPPLTQKVQTESLLKAWVILKTINERKLVENSANTGKYLLHQMQEHFDPEAQGLGMFIKMTKIPKQIRDVQKRLLPPLTLTYEEVDNLISRTRDSEHKLLNN